VGNSHLKVAVVTGASAGIGRAVAVELARREWRVGLLARGGEGLAGAEREVRAEGAEALALTCDVADPEAVFRAADEIVRRWGRMDLWINNAMVTVFAALQDITPAEFRRVTEVTYLGQVYGTMAALRHMREANCGTIIQVGSALSYRAIPLQSAYCGAKFAVRGFTESIRSELLHSGSGIRLCMVQLPAVNTPQFDWARSRLPGRPRPLPPVYDPVSVAKAIAAAATDPPFELWLGIPTAKAILGSVAVPRLLDRYLARNGYRQQVSRAPTSNQRDNLFSPVTGGHGVAGRFTREEKHFVSALNPSWLRGGLMLIALGLTGRWLSRSRDAGDRTK